MDAFADRFSFVEIGPAVAEEGHGRCIFHPGKGVLPELSRFRLAADGLDRLGNVFPQNGVDINEGLNRRLAAEARIRRLEFWHLLPKEIVGKNHFVTAEFPLQDQGGDCTYGFISGPVPGDDPNLGFPLRCLQRQSEVGHVSGFSGKSDRIGGKEDLADLDACQGGRLREAVGYDTGPSRIDVVHGIELRDLGRHEVDQPVR